MSARLRQSVDGLSYILDGSGPPVLLIQGIGVGANGWLPQTEALSSRYQCLSFDNRGYGESAASEEALSVEAMARDALALMDAQGWERAHVVGHSLGGLIALYVARFAAERVHSLALLCTFATGAVPTRVTPKIAWLGLRTRVGTRRMRRHAFLRMVMPARALATTDRDALAERLGALFGRDLADSPPIIMQQLRAAGPADATPYLPRLAHIPTLVVSGAHDPIAPPSAGRAIAAGIPGARYVEFHDGSHGLTIQHADRVNALLLEHLERAELTA